MFFLRLFEKYFVKQRLRGSASWLVVGLGNPGPKYRDTRHNVGFMVIDLLQRNMRSSREMNIDQSRLTIGKRPDGRSIALAQPQTFVNRSGAAVQALIKELDVPTSSCLIIVDDFHLPLGAVRLRRNGSDGGHNGLKSIIAAIGQDFPRLRIGIGPLPRDVAVIDFVLGNFEEKERDPLSRALAKAGSAVDTLIAEGIEAAMNRYN
jgi:PTH1 family peptidyl-tRNA hydrolase